MAITKTVTKTIDNEDRFEELTVFTGATYDLVKKLVTIVLPALGSLYFGLSQILGLPAGTEVVGCITLLTTFLGTLLGISSKRYNESDAPYDGKIVVQEDQGGVSGYSLELNGDPELLADQKSVSFKVGKAA